MRKIPSYILTAVIIFLVVFVFYVSSNLITRYWQELRLNKEFVCPENMTKEKSEAYLYRYTEFYFDNYPNITFNDFLSRRIQLLISHNCTVTLQNLANDNNGVLPNQNSVKELKNMPYGVNNKILNELR